MRSPFCVILFGLLLFLSCFPGGLAGKESACNAGDLGLIPGLGRSPGEGKGYPLQYSGLENAMDYYIVHGVAKSQTQLTFTLDALSILLYSFKKDADKNRVIYEVHGIKILCCETFHG